MNTPRQRPSPFARHAVRLGGAALLLALAGCSLLNFPIATSSACTMEARTCPDGSYVTRTGANCQFAPCPAAQ